MALSVKSEAKQFLTDSMSLLFPLIFKYVSCCPAKDASGKSSAVPEDLTATSVFS